MTQKNALTVIGFALLALLLASGGQRLLAEQSGSASAPSLISYQGFLSDSEGDPLPDGNYSMTFALYDAASGGAKIWEETQSNVALGGGYFSVMLGSGTCTTGCPLGPATFSDAGRYLQTTVQMNSGPVTFPRQQMASAPYALQAVEAQTAQTASSAPWSGLTGVPAGFADGVDDVGGEYENVITVAKSGGDYTSVAQALNSISGSSSSNRYLVQVMPGVYSETDLVEVKPYVHLRGSGPNATVVTSSRTGAGPNNSAATVDLADNGRVSDLTVRNESTTNYGIALYSAETSRAAVVDNVVAEVVESGGTAHFAAYWNDAEATIRNSTLYAGGAGTVNTAFGSVNISGGFPRALIEQSILLGGAANSKESCVDNLASGYGMQLSESSPMVRDSYICGGHRGIALATNGHPQVQRSTVAVSTTTNAYLFEMTASGSISVSNSGVQYSSNKHTGPGTGLRCVHNYHVGSHQAASDGTSTGTACN
ncbi:MAG TPA: pectinesterase family protein [Candidatus Sulfomarinibacteraceae bacterium]|nr:pectinesterase family protein [Candidatus Sulfomarinibacteraceae bacterium]